MCTSDDACEENVTVLDLAEMQTTEGGLCWNDCQNAGVFDGYSLSTVGDATNGCWNVDYTSQK